MKKLFYILSILVFFSAAIFAQTKPQTDGAQTENSAPQKERKNLFGSTYTTPHGAQEFFSQVSATVNLGANILLNTESKLKSAPSPVNFALSIGAIWPNNAFVSFQPRLSVFTTYYLWSAADNYAFPAEVENRTALALSFMFDLPAALTFRFSNCQIETGLGVGILARFALLARGVSANETGTTGSAGGDKAEIQKWFWKDARFLYPEIFVAWEWRVSERLAAGLEARWYIPIGSFIAHRGLDASIIAVSAKVIF